MKVLPISLLIILGIIGLLKIPRALAYDGGLIFYDLGSKVKLLPPIITSSRNNTSLNMPSIGQPCECRKKGCGCCVGMNLPAVNFDERVCANVTRSTKQQEWVLRLYRNENQLVMYKLSSFTPPPFCIPLPLPLPIRMCLQVREIMFVDSMLHMCLDWIVQIFSFEIYRLHFACFRLGTGGINILPGVTTTTAPGLAVTDEQVNGGVYDPVLLDRSLKNNSNNMDELITIYQRKNNILGFK